LLAIHRLQRVVNDGRFSFQVDLVVESESELLSPSATIQNYDIQHGHALLWGADFFGKEKAGKLVRGGISKSDALQLLFNRQGSLLIGLLGLAMPDYDEEYMQVQLSKPLLAMMAALLVYEGEYTARASEQLVAVEAGIRRNRDRALWKSFEDDAIMNLLRTAVAFKEKPEKQHFQPFNSTAKQIAKHYCHFLKKCMILQYGLSESSDTAMAVAAFVNAQPVAPSLMRPGWWAARLRGGHPGVGGRSVHPQVEVYARQFRWLSDQANSDSIHSRDNGQLADLVAEWKVSGFGCSLK
jgi:hypothetical protein